MTSHWNETERSLSAMHEIKRDAYGTPVWSLKTNNPDSLAGAALVCASCAHHSQVEIKLRFVECSAGLPRDRISTYSFVCPQCNQRTVLPVSKVRRTAKNEKLQGAKLKATPRRALA